MDFLSRKAVRHLLIRRRNERIADLRDDRWPRAIWLETRSLEELLMDPDPGEALTIESLVAGGYLFLGIPLIGDPRLRPGEVSLDWDGEPLPRESEVVPGG